MKQQEEKVKLKKYNEEVICYQIQELESKYIKSIVRSNKALRVKLKLFNVDKLTDEDIEEARNQLLTHFIKSKILQESIIVMWQVQAEECFKLIRKYPEREALAEQVDFKHPELTLITTLWDSPKEDHKALGDELYEIYKQNKNKEEEGLTMNQMKHEMNLTQCIEYMTTTQEKMKHLERLLQEKEAQIQELKKVVDPIPYLKECKKQIVATNNNVEACMKLINKQESYFDKKIETIEKALASLEQEIKQKEGGASTKDLLMLSNNLTKSFKQMQDDMKKEVKNELTNILNSTLASALTNCEKDTTCKEDKVISVEYDDVSNKKEEKEVEDEIADILKGLQL